jgi:nucleotide-binding universal stress UspA family protein
MRSLLSVDDLESRAGDLLAEAEATATAAGVETVTTAVRDGHAHEEIRSAATEHDVDLVAMGVHGTTGFSHSVLGGVVSKTLRVASVPVLLRRDAGADASR